MPRLPRNLSGDELVKKLRGYGYGVTRQTGSHVRPTRTAGGGEHHVTIPNHRTLRVGTLNILTDVAAELGRDKDEVVDELFG